MAGGGGSRSREGTGDLLTWWNQRRQIHRDLVTRARESEVIREQNKTCQFLRSHPCRPRSLTGDSSVMHRAIPSIAYANGVSVDVKFRDLYGAEGDRHGNAALKPQAQAIAVVRRQRASPQTTTRFSQALVENVAQEKPLHLARLILGPTAHPLDCCLSRAHFGSSSIGPACPCLPR